MTFEELYREVLQSKMEGRPVPENLGEREEHELDCLLHPGRYPLVWQRDTCGCSDNECAAACIFHAIEIRDGRVVINPEKCTGCAACLEACKNGTLTMSRDAVRAIELLKSSDTPVYALMAPAFIGQFGPDATPGRLRTALKQFGFAGMIEVAAFADILTLKEALEFTRNQSKPGNFQLTSCCCPVWIALIRKNFSQIAGHLPPSVSPMVACGRIAKTLHRGCKTIFVGPCLAKKAEAKEEDLAGAVDCVLTFQELRDIFEVMQIDFSVLEGEDKEHSAKAGRLYARAGGVSQAVYECVESLPDPCRVEAVSACSVPDCKKLLEDILEGKAKGNFFEGMGCPGGCVGGPKRILDVDEATRQVDSYAGAAPYPTPAENPYVIDVIKRLGFQNVDDFLHNSEILTRAL